MNLVRKSLMRHSLSLATCKWSAAFVFGVLIAALFSHAADPATHAAQPAAKTFRLADGSEIPIEQYGETYETLEWRPPIDPRKAKVIADNDSEIGTGSIALDLLHKRVYWFLGPGRHGTLMRANLDGSGRKMLLNGLSTPDGVKEIEVARQLNVIPELKKIFWICLGRRPDPIGVSIYEADLDGENPKSIVTGLQCTCLIVDPTSKKMYYNDDKTILRSNLDGTETEELGAKSVFPFAIDFKRKLIFAIEGEGITKQAFDGSGHRIVYECRGIGTRGINIALDESSGHLFWQAQDALLRAPVDDLYRFEEVIDIGPYRSPSFAVDTIAQRLYWIDKNRDMLSAPLPSIRMPVTRSAPPLITDFDPAEAAYGGEITIRGSGLSQCRRLYWIGVPTAKFIEGKILSLSNDAVTTRLPDLGPDCAHAHAVLTGDDGTTVTLSHDTTAVHKYSKLTRAVADKRFAFVAQDQSWLEDVEHRLVFLQSGGRAVPGVRGANIYFVKNGGTGHLIEQPGIVFHEPHARLTGITASAVRIPTPAIRASFVDELLTIKK